MPELLSDHTTFHLGGPARVWVEGTSIETIVRAVSDADAAGNPVLILSGGSNMVVADEGFPGTVVHMVTRGIVVDDAACDLDGAACGGVVVTVQAGEVWDSFVQFAVDHELVGIEALSGIPGLVGSTPIQNVGAYGSEIAHSIWSVRVYDRLQRQFRTFAAAECGFGYRTSRFKAEPGRYVVLEVSFQLKQGSLSAPIRFGELASRLGIEGEGRAPLALVRETVLDLRRGKGMVTDPSDHDSWSAGSFFTNPILPADAAASLPADAPRYPLPDGTVKSSAAWLIDHAGFHKGYGRPPATLSTRHTLALTNRGGATTAEVVALAREVRDGVRERFGVTLVPEPVFVGVSLDGS